jgi:sacsin
MERWREIERRERESFLKLITTLLGTGILTELLQNADDARATQFALYLDKNEYPSQSLMAPTMEAWQGPSLCVFNNALFTNEDFR